MNSRSKYNKPSPDYWKDPEPGFPRIVYWKIVSGNRKLDVLEDHDLIFSQNDEKWLKSL